MKFKQDKASEESRLRQNSHSQAKSDALSIALLLDSGWGRINLKILKELSVSLKYHYHRSEMKESIVSPPLELIMNELDIVLVKIDRSDLKNQADWNSRRWNFSEAINDDWMPLDDLISSIEKLATFVSSRGDECFYEKFNLEYIENHVQLNIPENFRISMIEKMKCSTELPFDDKEMILHVNCMRRLHLASKMYDFGFFKSYGHDNILNFFYKFHRDLLIVKDIDVFFLNWFEVYESPSRSNYLDHLLHITKSKFIEDAEFIVTTGKMFINQED